MSALLSCCHEFHLLSQMTLHNPSTELLNITFHGSWAIRGNSRDISQLPPVFYICSEDFRPLGIRAHVFGAACFVLVYAIPGKFAWLITNIFFLFYTASSQEKWYRLYCFEQTLYARNRTRENINTEMCQLTVLW